MHEPDSVGALNAGMQDCRNPIAYMRASVSWRKSAMERLQDRARRVTRSTESIGVRNGEEMNRKSIGAYDFRRDENGDFETV